MKNNSKPWTNSELAMLRSMYATHDNKALSLYTGHNVDAVQYMAGKLGLRKPQRSCRKSVWEPWKIDYLRIHYTNAPAKDLADQLGMSPSSVHKKARRLGLAPYRIKNRFVIRKNDKTLMLTPEGERFLREHFATCKNEKLKDVLGIGAITLARFARQLCLKKSPEHLSRCSRETINKLQERYREQGYPLNGNALPNAEKHQFKKGHPPLDTLGPEGEAYRLRRIRETREQKRRQQRVRTVSEPPADG